MALLQESDSFESARASRKASEFKRKIIKKYGQGLGEALLQYTREDTDSISSKRKLFSEVVANMLQNGTVEQKALAIEALLVAVEARLEPVAEMAHEAHISTSVY